MRAPTGLVGSHTRRTPETWRNPPPWCSACASPCSSARESSRPVISSFITTLANGSSSPTSRRVRGPAGSVRVLAPPEVHENKVPEQVVPEPAEVRTGMDRRRQACDTGVERPELVERVREGVDRPGVARVLPDRRLRDPERLVATPRLLEREGVEAEHEGAAGIVPGQHAREVEHLPELPLPEPDEVEPLEHHHVPRKVGEMPGHRGLGVVRLALDQEGDRL